MISNINNLLAEAAANPWKVYYYMITFEGDYQWKSVSKIRYKDKTRSVYKQSWFNRWLYFF